LRAAIPPGIAEALDWLTLAPCPGNFIDQELRERYTDALFSLTWRGSSDAPVYVLFEHQSTPDSQMAFRLLCYAVRIWERWQRDHPHADTLPMVVPVVLCHGAAPWPAPMTLDALLDLPGAVRSAAADQLPWFTYLLDDLSQISDHELRNLREMTATSRLARAFGRDARRDHGQLNIRRQRRCGSEQRHRHDSR
jgi:predicted transposase/invertase (TIGR01784 family)